jgi:hypothetical protein
MNEKLDIYLSDFGQTVVFDTTSGPREVRAIFDNAFYDASINETVLDTTQPFLTCKFKDVEHDIERGTPVNIEAKRFSVLQIQPDGTGMATVFLAHE